ncbi:MDR family MFS transporter [Cellulomonas sp. PhB143]|uniref:MDR family MFS transporter n=1 Tax=Cellulomonas sp. PhB143 TaxID=2485186 RepID=UPI000F481D03|nr:MDR family MFS transporter [Cellulomonas sp. PhB143]ROS79076.1 EmrB/QacA subfamily drug resistance transporter [Cellulomonas sp. PhB143]
MTNNSPGVRAASGPDTTVSQSEHRGILLVFAGLMVAMLLAALDQTIFATALPTIVGELDGVNHMLWVTTAYILAATIMMPVYGKLGDLVGRKYLFMAAIALFMVGSVIGGLAQDMTSLIVGRAVQGLGGGGLMILAQAIIADVVPARQRGKYMGIMGGVFALASVAGPLLGGWFTESIGWRWAFWMNIPLGVLALVSAGAFLHLPKVERSRPRIDVAGMVLLALASTCVVLVTTWGGSTYDWASAQIFGLIVGAIVLGVAFVLVERRAAEPVMPLFLFKERNFVLTTVAGLFVGIAMFGAMAYMPTYLQMVTGKSATVAGLLMIPMMGAMLITSIVSGRVVTRTGRYKFFPVFGLGFVGLSLVLLSTLSAGQAVWVICAYLAVLGLGLGLSMQILILIVQNTFPIRVVGTATASNNYFRQIGASIGSAVVGSLFVQRLTDLLAERMPAGASGGTDTNAFTPAAVQQMPDAIKDVIVSSYNDALMPVFLYIAPLAVLGLIALLFVKETPLATRIDRGSDPTGSATDAADGVVDPVTGAGTPVDPSGAELEDGLGDGHHPKHAAQEPARV